jgi:hypothetical protein
MPPERTTLLGKPETFGPAMYCANWPEDAMKKSLRCCAMLAVEVDLRTAIVLFRPDYTATGKGPELSS